MTEITKQQFCVSCLRKKNVIWPGIIQQPGNAGSHRIGVKTRLQGLVKTTEDIKRVKSALASLDYRSQ